MTTENKPAREKISFERVEREKLLTQKSSEEDTILDLSLRPSKITEFIGQEDLKENSEALPSDKNTLCIYVIFRYFVQQAY